MESVRYKQNEKTPMPAFFQMINTLSIDVVIGSILCTIMVVKLFNINPNWPLWIVLPISVWIIYTLDHLVDAYRLKNKANTFRHRFHYAHLKTLVSILVILSILNLIVILIWLDREIIYFGLVLFFISSLYIIYIHKNGNNSSFISKEIIVSVIYTIGIWGGPISLNQYFINIDQLLLLIAFFLLVLADVLLLSFYESESDKKDNHITIAVKYGKSVTLNLIYVLIFLVFGISIFLISTNEIFLFRSVAKLFLIMGLLEIIIASFSDFFEKKKIYRYFIECLFWIPGLVILL